MGSRSFVVGAVIVGVLWWIGGGGGGHGPSAESARLRDLRQTDRAAFLAELKTKDPDRWWRELIMAADSDPEQFRPMLDEERKRRAFASKVKLNQADAASCRDPYAAWVVAQDLVAARLKAPASAVFPWQHEAKFEPGADCTMTVRAHVDAQNAYGAMLRLPFTVTVRGHPPSDKWTLVSIDLRE